MPVRKSNQFVRSMVGAILLAFIGGSAHAADTGPLVARLDRLVDANETRLIALAHSADTAIDRMAARNADAAALAVAGRVRTQIETMSARTRLTLERTRDSLIRKFATGADAGQVRATLNLSAVRLGAEIDQHLAQCLAEIDASLADAGLSNP